MKNIKAISFPVAALSILFTASCKEETSEAEVKASELEEQIVTLESMEDKLSYLMGYSMASQLGDAGLNLNSDVVLKAIADAQSGKQSLVAEADARMVGGEFQRLLQEKRIQAAKEANQQLGLEFRLSNAERAEVTQTESGLQYEVITASASGAKKPSEQDSVKVNYHGTLIDGTVFDSSVDRGEPVTFGVSQVIAGWTEVLQLMAEGDKWRVVIPGELAYPNGTRNIQPGSTLIFEIELLEVNPES